MMVGTIIHEILESVLKQKLRTLAEIKTYCQDYIKTPAINYLLYSSGCTREKLAEEVSRFVPKIYSFIDRYILKSQSVQEGAKDNYAGAIEDIEDTEENLWLPRMGLKGKIDLTVRVRCGAVRQTVPLELKTGRASFSIEHKGQVTLYQMMMEESGRNARSGLLLYLREGILREVASTRNEKRDLIMLRNELSRYLSRKFTQSYGEHTFLEYPDPIQHRNACENCPYNTICTSLLSRDAEKPLRDSHPLKKCQKIDHLSEQDLDYFFRWCQISYLEDQETIRGTAVSNIWTDSIEQRVQSRKTIFGLKLKTIQEQETGEYHHVFEVESLQSLKHDLKAHDYVVVSVPPHRWAVATGFVVSISQTTVTLNLNKKMNEFRSDVLRVDRYESQSMLSYHLTNLGILLEDSEKSHRLRVIISGGANPIFEDNGNVILNTTQGMEIMNDLNEGQRNAIQRSLTCQNYLLIKGLPGTGKTQTISALIRLLVLSGQSVLVTAHTHTAIDNLLLRIKAHDVRFLRLGSASRTHLEIREFCESFVIESCKSPEEIASKFNSFPVVGVTCLGAGHSLLARRQFDVCIVDEATQVIQTALLRPLFSCTKFILVGDPDQLPPVLQSSQAITAGGDKSLFLHLDDEQRGTTAKLTVQYRMNRTITRLANQFMYKNELLCGSERVEKQCLDSFDLKRIPNGCRKLFARILSPHLDLATLMVDTGPVEDLNREFGKRHKWKVNENHCEVAFILRIINFLRQLGMSLQTVGVIAPFRIQVEAIKETLKRKIGPDHLVEVNTVDQYQGRDKELIIYSGTKTRHRDATEEAKAEMDGSDILNDRRRLNVAITRAKKKLIMVMDRQCLQRNAPFEELFKYLKGPQVIRLERAELEDSLEEYRDLVV